MNQKKNPTLALILSLIVAGLGQLYLGKFLKAAVFFLLYVITAGIYGTFEFDIFGVPNFLVCVIAAYDAYDTAKKINKNIKPKTEDLSEIPEIHSE